MSEETEIWGELTPSLFESHLETFSTKFGPPTKSKRISLQADHFKRHDLDTRIRITDGQVELVQKVGKWEATTRNEIQVPLTLSAPDIYNLYQILINQLPLEYRQTNIIQYTNYVFDTDDFELKLSQQVGKQTVYHYELEAKTAIINLEQTRHKLGLPAALVQSDETFWTEWNQRVNLEYGDFSQKTLISLIQTYFDKS